MVTNHIHCTGKFNYNRIKVNTSSLNKSTPFRHRGPPLKTNAPSWRRLPATGFPPPARRLRRPSSWSRTPPETRTPSAAPEGSGRTHGACGRRRQRRRRRKWRRCRCWRWRCCYCGGCRRRSGSACGHPGPVRWGNSCDRWNTRASFRRRWRRQRCRWRRRRQRWIRTRTCGGWPCVHRALDKKERPCCKRCTCAIISAAVTVLSVTVTVTVTVEFGGEKKRWCWCCCCYCCCCFRSVRAWWGKERGTLPRSQNAVVWSVFS